MAMGDVIVQVESILHGQMAGGNEPKTTLLPWQNRIQQILRDTLDWSQLAIAGHDGYAWRACITLIILKDDGGVVNALLLAAVAALSNASRPVHLQKQPNERLGSVSGGEEQIFVMSRVPFGLTLGYRPSNKGSLALQWLIDPTAEEEAALDSLVHIVIVDNSLWAVEWTGKICHLEQHLPFLETLAVGRAKELWGLLSLEKEG
jgi:exosome complex RNA-binding protein Rrp42 (RNase PH superfamily)